MEELGEGPGMLMAAVDFAKEDAVRSQIPVLQQLRTDIYEVCEKNVSVRKAWRSSGFICRR